jgi:hypothetical protein
MVAEQAGEGFWKALAYNDLKQEFCEFRNMAD